MASAQRKPRYGGHEVQTPAGFRGRAPGQGVKRRNPLDESERKEGPKRQYREAPTETPYRRKFVLPPQRSASVQDGQHLAKLAAKVKWHLFCPDTVYSEDR